MNIKELWPKPHVVKLGEYDKVSTIEELYGYQSLIIEPIPITQNDGSKIQPPPMYFRKGDRKVQPIRDLSNVVWTREIQISKDGSHEEYCNRVDWWAEKSLANEEYRKLLNEAFNNKGFDIKDNWKKLIFWLKGPIPASSRKTKLHQFMWRRLKINYDKHVRLNKNYKKGY